MNAVRRYVLPAAAALALGAASAHLGTAAQVVRVGVARGAQEEILQAVREVAARKGLELRLLPFDDPARLDAALAAGRIDADGSADLAGLRQWNASSGARLVDVAYTVTLPLSFYSRRLASLRELGPDSTVALPDTPADCARALILLQNYGLIGFPDSAGLHAAPADVSSNPRRLRFIRLPAERLAAALPQVALAAIPWEAAEQAGLRPARDSIGMEDARSPYAKVIAVRAEDRGKPWVGALVAAYHSPEIKHFILSRYQDSVRRPW